VEYDIVLKLKSLLGDEFLVKINRSNNVQDYTIVDLNKKILRCSEEEYGNRLKANLNKLGLLEKKSEEKFIPKNYLTSCIEDRVQLLQGLIDTDGEVNNNNYVYSTISYQLALDIQFLAQSLGGTAHLVNRQTKFTYNDSVL
jgi:hypothetical protein